MDNIMEYLPFLIPLVLAQVILAVVAFVHVLKHDNYRFGTRPMWIIVVLLFQFVGPVVYFVFGRGEG